MTTALSIKTVDYPCLSPNSRQARIIAANLDGEPMTELDLIKVPTPAAGGTTWSFDNNGNVETTDEIVGLLVGIGKRGVLWPHEDPSDKPPVVVSHDLLVAYRTSDDSALGDISPKSLEKHRIGDRQYDWVSLSSSPEFGKGSARNGTGRRCKESRLLAILRHGEAWPLLVSVGPGSLWDWNRFQKRLPDVYWACEVGLRLRKEKSDGGAPYSVITPRVAGVISEEQAEMARALYAEPLKKMFDAPPIRGGGSAAAADGDL